MNLKWLCIILSLVVSINGSLDSDIEAFVSLTELGYEDACTKAAEAKWSFIKESNNATRQKWENTLEEYAEYVRTQKKEITSMTDGTLENPLLQYKFSLITKPGDASLEAEEWHQFVSFVGGTELSIIIGNQTKPDRSLRQRGETLLASSIMANEKLKIWTSWYDNLKPLTSKFTQSLKLVENATAANDVDSVDKYWAMLSDYERGHEEIANMWENIARLHKRIVDFVQKRLTEKYSKDYKITNETLPAHLLGSLQGYDWTQLALYVIPYPNITFEIRENLLHNGLVGNNLYKAASRMGKILLKHVPEAEFWEQSDFKAQCPSNLINLCNGNMRLSTCSNHSSIANYLSAHKNVAKKLVHQMSMENSPILNVANRYSAIDSAVEELFGVLSMSRAWLLSLNLVKESDDQDEVRVVSLMMTALDVLPRLAHYLAADMWRLDSIKNKLLDPNELTATWWEYRKKYEGISTISTDVPTFLDNEHIISNKPYLSKFLGILLGFQMYEAIMDSTEMRYNEIESISLKHELIKMIQYGSGNNWTEVVKKYLDIYEVSSDSLVKYFSPLEEYLDEIEGESMDPIPPAFEEALEKLEDEYRRKNEITPSTSKPTTMMTSTTATLKMEKLELSKAETTPSELKTSPHQSVIRDKSAESPKKEQSVDNEEEDDDEIIKSGTSKAVWAVGAVLIATVTIVTIAIFGRQRCRKTPKNRRYV
ncbi:angiotensin-converting enzyme [Diachasma alloeum]|uniref:angiotensin-converting enzyme n=1 Tax=Diachasma alloeum TaxID=454923 RepID=UPI000738195D|nr:angiotensin-converting enzyme [Diachasma alloeum]XP_015117893.1 angiotensin-converting enzyme [Diachasma alloeum]XP_015117898.1 angiotensin-converting enzyme [Diachasma alloeum]